MAHYHLLHVSPPEANVHIFNGYLEVITSVAWGLRELGHQTSYLVNNPVIGAVNIVFGAHLLSIEVLNFLPENCIIYNLEQLNGLLFLGRDTDEFRRMAERFVIWDYSMVNVGVWRELIGARRVRHVPIGFAPVLCRIAKPAEQDIDVLIYGGPTDTRMRMLQHLCASGLSTLFVCGLYGAARDGLIARAKLVVNIGTTSCPSIFSIVRVSYLLANRKAVVADIDGVVGIEGDLLTAVKFSELDLLPAWCEHLVQHPDQRLSLEEQGFRIIARRDVRAFLASALDGCSGVEEHRQPVGEGAALGELAGRPLGATQALAAE